MSAAATDGAGDAFAVQDSFKQRLRALESQLVTLRTTNRTLEQRAFDALQRGHQLAHALGFVDIDEAERVVAEDPATWNRATVEYWKVRMGTLEREVKELKEEIVREGRERMRRADDLESVREENEALRKEMDRLKASAPPFTSAPTNPDASTSTLQIELADLQSRYDALLSAHRAAAAQHRLDLRKWRKFKMWLFTTSHEANIEKMLRSIGEDKPALAGPSSKEDAQANTLVTPAPAKLPSEAQAFATPALPAPFVAALPTPSTAPRTPRKARPLPAPSSVTEEERTPLGRNVANEPRSGSGSASSTPSKRKERAVSVSPSKRRRSQEDISRARSVSVTPSKRRRIREEIDQEERSPFVSPSKRSRGPGVRSPFASPSKRGRNGASSVPGTPSRRAREEPLAEEESQTQEDSQALAFWPALAAAAPHLHVGGPALKRKAPAEDDAQVKVEVKEEPLDGGGLGMPSPKSVKKPRVGVAAARRSLDNRTGKGKGKGKARASDPGPGAAHATTINAHFEINPDANEGLPFQFDTVVRDKAHRAQLEGGECECCRDYYADVGPLPPRLQPPPWRSPSPTSAHAAHAHADKPIREHRNAVSRHRAQWARGRTPPGYWDIGFPTTQEAAGINARAREMQRGQWEAVEKEAQKEGGKYRRRRG